MTDAQPKLPDWRIVTPPTPDELRRLYRNAQQETGTPWEYLAAVHLVETRMGRIRGTSTAGAQGPMQFLPSTFEQYGAGGDINDPGDAIMAAGRMLANNGAPGDMSGALWSYNHSDRYVAAVSAYAEQMKRSAAAYDLYWHWQVLYRHQDGTMLLPEGYPGKKPVRID
nr:lytic transglycosylase domain-containing protein [Nocardioides albus]